MKNFFESIKNMMPSMMDYEINERLNDFEVKLFEKLPWALKLPEEQQNELIIYVYGMKYGVA